MENEEKQSGIKRTLKRLRNRKRYGDTAHKQEKEKKHIKKKKKKRRKRQMEQAVIGSKGIKIRHGT